METVMVRWTIPASITCQTPMVPPLEGGVKHPRVFLFPLGRETKSQCHLTILGLSLQYSQGYLVQHYRMTFILR